MRIITAWYVAPVLRLVDQTVFWVRKGRCNQYPPLLSLALNIETLRRNREFPCLVPGEIIECAHARVTWLVGDGAYEHGHALVDDPSAHGSPGYNSTLFFKDVLATDGENPRLH